MIAGGMRSLIQQLIGRTGFELKRTPNSQQANLVRQYLQRGAIPWSPGYAEAKQKLICDVLMNSGVMERFQASLKLPDGYGIGIDERCVEYPWLLANLGASSETILDAGSVLNHAFVLDSAQLQNRKLHILTLAPEGNCYWNRGISYLFADLRDIPIRDSYYDNIACISTLEHVGCDNSGISGLDVHRESHFDDFTIVMRELHRILKPAGTLYLTVPYGLRRNFGSFQQFDGSMVSRAIEAFGSARQIDATFYRYTSDGWNVATEAECASCEFVEWIVKVWRGELQSKDVVVDSDKAAAARAVACIRMVKS